jgi:hypothetical protein
VPAQALDATTTTKAMTISKERNQWHRLSSAVVGGGGGHGWGSRWPSWRRPEGAEPERWASAAQKQYATVRGRTVYPRPRPSNWSSPTLIKMDCR